MIHLLTPIFKQYNFDTYKTIKNKIYLYVDLSYNERKILLQEIHLKLKDATINYECSESSIGRVEYLSNNKRYFFYIKPLNRQGDKSSGLSNEQAAFNLFHKYINEGIRSFEIGDGNESKTYNNIIDVKIVGQLTGTRKNKKKRINKADIILISENQEEFPISIKQENSVNWESSETFFGAIARNILEQTITKKMVLLEKIDNVNFHINKNIAIKAKQSEKKQIIFGNDILNNGIIIINNFHGYSPIIMNNVCKIFSTRVIFKEQHIKNDNIYFLIRNTKNRYSKFLYRGLRVVACTEKRITKQCVIITNRED